MNKNRIQGDSTIDKRYELLFRAMPFITVILVALTIATSSVQAGEWPMKGHDLARTGHTDESIEPPFRLLWKVETGGAVTSSPAVSNGIVYVGSSDSNLYVIDASTGEVRWTYETDAPVRSSPSVSNGIVYFGSDDKKVYALDADTGKELWSYVAEGKVLSSPVTSGEHVYVGSNDGYVHALDARTGTQRWKYLTIGIKRGERTVSSNGRVGMRMVVVRGISSSPAVSNDTVYIGSDDGRIYALDATTGELRWTKDTDGTELSSPAVVGEIVYISWSDMVGVYKSGGVTAFFTSTGGVAWKIRAGSGAGSSPSVSRGVLYVGLADSTVNAYDATRGGLLWERALGGGVGSKPAIADKLLYIGSGDGRVYGLDKPTGQELWSYKTGDEVASSPAITDGVLYVGSADGNVYAFASLPALMGIAREAVSEMKRGDLSSIEALAALAEAETDLSRDMTDRAANNAQKAITLARDVDGDGIPNDSDIAPSVRNAYLYALAILILVFVAQLLKREMHRRKEGMLAEDEVRRLEENRKLLIETRNTEMKEDILGIIVEATSEVYSAPEKDKGEISVETDSMPRETKRRRKDVPDASNKSREQKRRSRRRKSKKAQNVNRSDAGVGKKGGRAPTTKPHTVVRESSPDSSGSKDIPTAHDFHNALDNVLRAATRKGNRSVDIKAGDLHRWVGGYPDPQHRMPVCCNVMRSAMGPHDRIIKTPPKGAGASLTIRYRLPR